MPRGVDQVVDPDKDHARVWIADHTDLVHRQIALRKKHPTYPRSTGAIEGTIGRIRKAVNERAKNYRNGARRDRPSLRQSRAIPLATPPMDWQNRAPSHRGHQKGSPRL